MMSETQREVAVHLLANGLRKLRLDGQEPHRGTLSEGAGLEFRGARRGARDEAYVKGMLDMLSGLFGATYSNELLRAAYALERSASTR
jgi:hypothetical protein